MKTKNIQRRKISKSNNHISLPFGNAFVYYSIFLDNNNAKEENTMYNFSSIHTGSNATDPGVLKAQADKDKRDSS